MSDREQECVECDGTGRRRGGPRTVTGFSLAKNPCPVCDGEGVVGVTSTEETSDG